MSIFYTGSIKIISISQDENGVTTETIGPEIQARVEDYNRIVKDQYGQDVVSNTFIAFDYKKTVNYGDKILIITKEKLPYSLPNKKWKIIKLSNIGGFTAHHIEVYL